MFGPKNTARDVAATLIAGLNDGSIVLRQAESGSGGADLLSGLFGVGHGYAHVAHDQEGYETGKSHEKDNPGSGWHK